MNVTFYSIEIEPKPSIKDYCMACVQNKVSKGSHCADCQPEKRRREELGRRGSKLKNLWSTFRAYWKRKGKRFDAKSGY